MYLIKIPICVRVVNLEGHIDTVLPSSIFPDGDYTLSPAEHDPSPDEGKASSTSEGGERVACGTRSRKFIDRENYLTKDEFHRRISFWRRKESRATEECRDNEVVGTEANPQRKSAPRDVSQQVNKDEFRQRLSFWREREQLSKDQSWKLNQVRPEIKTGRESTSVELPVPPKSKVTEESSEEGGSGDNANIRSKEEFRSWLNLWLENQVATTCKVQQSSRTNTGSQHKPEQAYDSCSQPRRKIEDMDRANTGEEVNRFEDILSTVQLRRLHRMSADEV